MYVHPFVCGVVATIFVEILVIFTAVLYEVKKPEDTNEETKRID